MQVEDRKYIVFEGAYLDEQCWNANFSDSIDYSSITCTCFNYKLRTSQNREVYLGTNTYARLYISVCFDQNSNLIDMPNTENIKLALEHMKNSYLSLTDIDSITSNEINQKTKFGKYPRMTYRIDLDTVIWEVVRYNGVLNVDVYEFDVEASTGSVLEMKRLPFRRKFWQWLGGMKY